MSESKKNIEMNNGWILCPSKSFPGKFYYFNVVTGETAWSQTPADNKPDLKRQSSFHKIANKSHRYPEPTTLPDELIITSDNTYASTKKLDIVQNILNPIQLPMLGQAILPNNVPNVDPTTSNIVWTLVPMLCPETKKPMLGKVSQIPEFERELFSISSNIPLCERFKNYKKPSKFESSTPKNSFLECPSEPQNFLPKSLIEEPALKLKPKLPKVADITKSSRKPVLSLSSNIKSTNSSPEVPKIIEKEPALKELDRGDLRFLLLAKRNSFSAGDTVVERKKPKSSEVKTLTPKKMVTFNLNNEIDNGDTVNGPRDNFIPLSPNPKRSTIEASKSPLKLKDKIPPSFVKDTYETPKKPLPNVKNLTPTLQPTASNKTPTFQPTIINQEPTYQQTASNKTPTFQPTIIKRVPSFPPTACNKAPTFQSTIINQEPTYQQTASNKTPTFQPTIIKRVPSFQPTACNKAPSFQPTNINQAPTYQQTASNKAPSFQPTIINQVPTFQSTNINQAPPSQPTVTNQLPTFQTTVTNQLPTFKNKTWCIVVDTDVLLLDYEFIDKLVLSDPKCILMIPHAVASDIQALCLGDCRGQQRVITARQVTRKLATPPPHFMVETRTSNNGNLVVTTESILYCCMKARDKNYYVVLITNDPHLLNGATVLKIPAYKLNDVKNGVDISPKSALEQKNIKINNTSNETAKNTEKLLNQKLGLVSNFKITPETKSEEKIIKMNDGKNQFNNNYWSPKKQFSLSDSESEISFDDKLVNITKPKCMENIENATKSDSVCTSDMSSMVSSLQLRDENVLKPQNDGRNQCFPENDVRNQCFPQNDGRNQCFPQNVEEKEFGSFEIQIPNPKAVFNNNCFGKQLNESRIIHRKDEINNFQNDLLDYNFENKEEFCPIPITNIVESKSKLENSVTPNKCSTLRQDTNKENRDNKMLKPSQARIEKLIKSVNTDSTPKTQLANENTKTKDSMAVFKIPKLLPIKNKTRNRTAHGENSTTTDKIGKRTSIDTIDKSLKNFFRKNKNMESKINKKIDECICCFMQIMEDVLVNILQTNKVCMENTVAPLTIKDTLNCVKMLYDSHTKVTDVINKLSELLEQCVIGVPGQPKMPVTPEDFIKILGCGKMLVLELKYILPQNEDLKEAKLLLSKFHNNLIDDTKDLIWDPELVKTPYVSRIDIDRSEDKIRPQFFKNTSYVIEYLKKHFKDWESYKEDLDERNHNIENHNDFKVVRTLGKNLNLLKIDMKKNMSLSKDKEDDIHNKKAGPKIYRLLETNQIIKPENEEINKTSEENLNTTDQEKVLTLNKITENIEQNQNFESKDDEFNYTSHENTFLGENKEKDEPKIVRNIKLINEFENKLKTREPLDLDLLDYSEIYEPSIDINPDFDILLEKNDKTENNNNFVDDNYGLENMFTLEDFYITPTISNESDKNEKNTIDAKITENSNKIEDSKISENITGSYFNSVSESKLTTSNIEENNQKNNSEVESETFTEKQESHNDSCIGNDISESHVDNSDKHVDSSEKQLDNSETNDENIGKTAQITQDDSINDSGFENDSTYAHLMVKVFLKELCSTFKVTHTFVTNFIDEIGKTKLSEKRMDVFHNQASKALEDMVAIINHLKEIIKRESAADTALKMLLRNAGVEAATDKRMMRYREVVIKCLEQAQILESALKTIISTTIGDFDALSTNAEPVNTKFRYFNIFESGYQPFLGNT